MDVSPSNPQEIYITWAEDPDGVLGPDEADIFFTRSIDGGNTFRTPQNLSDPATAPFDQFEPWIAVKPDGTIDVVWYDRRNDPLEQEGMKILETVLGVHEPGPQRRHRVGIRRHGHERDESIAVGHMVQHVITGGRQCGGVSEAPHGRHDGQPLVFAGRLVEPAGHPREGPGVVQQRTTLENGFKDVGVNGLPRHETLKSSIGKLLGRLGSIEHGMP